jgi:hypothetical protein
MKSSINDKLSLFAENVQAIKGSFRTHMALTKKLAAILYALEGKPVDNDAIKQCHALIKENTKLFSSFRGNMTLYVSTRLSLNEDPSRLFAHTLEVYDLFKSVKFKLSDYRTVSALLVASSANPQDYRYAVERAKVFYDGMKKNRWFITGQDDYIFSTMLGLSDIDPAYGAERVEQLYRCLIPDFRFIPGSNAVQLLAQVLVLGGKSNDTLDHIFALRDALQSQKVKLDKTYTLPALGVLALLPADGEVLANDLMEAQAFLKLQKGFGSFSISTQELLLFASAIVAADYARDIKDNIVAASVTTSIINVIIAIQVAIIAAMSASAAAAAAASALG